PPSPKKGSNFNKFSCVENRDVPEYLQPTYDSAHFSPRPSVPSRPYQAGTLRRYSTPADLRTTSLRRRLSDIDATHHVRRSRPCEARTSSHNNHEAPSWVK
ncbi:unnamed protein product, partial [Ectocarpus sp. 12 AP-2014]